MTILPPDQDEDPVIYARTYFATKTGRYAEAVRATLASCDPWEPEDRAYAEAKVLEWERTA